jgi:hypothetical protein
MAKKGISKAFSEAFSEALADGRTPKKRVREASPKLREIVPPTKKTVPGRAVTLRDLARAAMKEGAHVVLSLEPRGSTRYEVAPGRSVSIQPVEGMQKVFGHSPKRRAELNGVCVEIMINTDGELIFDLTMDHKLLGTALVADHLRIA